MSKDLFILYIVFYIV